MTRMRCLGILLATLTLPACTELDEELGTTSQASMGHQGMRLQGMRLQGMRLQGMRLQGMRLQGMRLQGMRLQGMRLQGSALEAEIVVDRKTEIHTSEWHYLVSDGLKTGPYPGGLEGNATLDVVLPNGDQFTVLLASVRKDDTFNAMVNPSYTSNDDVQLWQVETTDGFQLCETPEGDVFIPSLESPAGADDTCKSVRPGTNLCPLENKKAPFGEGMFLEGTWDETGAWSSDGITLACTAGVLSKCVRSWGYKPWATLTDDQGVEHSMHDLHLPCVRAARADYKGDGESFTKDGTMVDLYDNYGFNQKVSELDPTLMAADEAVFDKDGAWLMSTVRWQDVLAANPGGYDPTLIDELGEEEYVEDLLEYGFAGLKSWYDDPLDGQDVAYKYSSHTYEVGVETTTYCTHSVCETGVFLAESCNACTRLVCADPAHANCCVDHGDTWDETCVNYARHECDPVQTAECGAD